MKIWHISDTHMNHAHLQIPADVDVVVNSGNATNCFDPLKNLTEMQEFLAWFSSLPIRQKIFVPGNHDTSIEKNLIQREVS